MGLAWYNGFDPALRQRSWDWLKELLAEKRIPLAMECQACGQTDGAIDYHAEDYSEPFGAHIYEFQFCFRCHMMIHCRFRQKQGWIEYRDAIRSGARFRPLWRYQFEVAVKDMANLGSVSKIQRPDVEVVAIDPVLDRIDAGVYKLREPRPAYVRPAPILVAAEKVKVSRKPEVCDLPVNKHWPK